MKITSIFLLILTSMISCKKEYQCECKRNGIVTKVVIVKAQTRNKANLKCSEQGDNAAYVCWNCETCELKN